MPRSTAEHVFVMFARTRGAHQRVRLGATESYTSLKRDWLTATLMFKLRFCVSVFLTGQQTFVAVVQLQTKFC